MSLSHLPALAGQRLRRPGPLARPPLRRPPAPAAARHPLRPRPPHRHLLVPRRRHHRRLPPGLRHRLRRRPPRRRTWPSPPCCAVKPLLDRADVCCWPSTTRPRRATAPGSRAPASTTTPAPARPARSSSTATSGSPWPPWPRTPTGAPSPCPCRPSSTSARPTWPSCPPTARRPFRTKLELAAEQLRLAEALGGRAASRSSGWWSMAATPRGRSCEPARQDGCVVVGRLRKDAALWSLPEPQAGRRSAGRQADLRQGAARPGQAGRAAARLAAGGVRAVRREGDQDDQDVPGDVAAGRRA